MPQETAPQGHGPADEYNALRDELHQGKTYVFERPMLIFTLSLGALEFMKDGIAGYVPPIAIGLLCFNLWFTANRLCSMSRIIAYIQVELEEKAWRPWLGWETCLYFYRIWAKQPTEDESTDSAKPRATNASPKALVFYKPIFALHVCVVLVLVAFAASRFYMTSDDGAERWLQVIASIAMFVVFGVYALTCLPGKFLHVIEEYRNEWTSVFEFLERKEIKTRIKEPLSSLLGPDESADSSARKSTDSEGDSTTQPVPTQAD